MQSIAERAMVSKRTLYKYFPTKEDLYNALVDEILSCVDTLYESPYSRELSIEEQVRRIVKTKIELTLSDSFLSISRIVFGELLKKRMPTPAQMERFYQSERLFIAWIHEAQNDGRVTKELGAEEIAGQFHSILKGQIYWPLLLGLCQKKDLDLDNVCTQTVRFFMRSFT